MMRYSILAWCFLPVPLGCLIFGIFVKNKKNFIVGIIFFILLFSFGLFYLTAQDIYSTDTAYLEKLETETQIDFPEEVTVITQNWTGGTQGTTDNIYYKYESFVKFIDPAQTEMFINNIDKTKLCNDWEQLPGTVPLFKKAVTKNCEYFIIYCYETKSFNESNVEQFYNYVYMALDKEDSALYILEYFYL
ncbi:MAG: hypothetical protein IJD14_04100 [Christensenellaceae bacterium]|nr:hypothetical protein [Christensenellaceae bacterium]